MNKENLYSVWFFSWQCFLKEIENVFPMFLSIVIETLWKVWEISKSSLNFQSSFYKAIRLWAWQPYCNTFHSHSLSLNFSILLFVIHVNLLHPQPSLFLYGLLSLWCFSIFTKYYFQVSFNLMVILSMIKLTQNTAAVLL